MKSLAEEDPIVSSLHAVVMRQVEAYNLRDIDAFCSCFTDDVWVRTINTPEAAIVRGVSELRSIYGKLFQSKPLLHCTVRSSVSSGTYMIVSETVRGIAAGSLDVIAIYEVGDGLIRSLQILEPGTPVSRTH